MENSGLFCCTFLHLFTAKSNRPTWLYYSGLFIYHSFTLSIPELFSFSNCDDLTSSQFGSLFFPVHLPSPNLPTYDLQLMILPCLRSIHIPWLYVSSFSVLFVLYIEKFFISRVMMKWLSKLTIYMNLLHTCRFVPYIHSVSPSFLSRFRVYCTLCPIHPAIHPFIKPASQPHFQSTSSISCFIHFSFLLHSIHSMHSSCSTVLLPIASIHSSIALFCTFIRSFNPSIHPLNNPQPLLTSLPPGQLFNPFCRWSPNPWEGSVEMIVCDALSIT